MSRDELELFRLLARFKVQLRRAHGRGVDLELLTADRDYADRLLGEIEALTDDEGLIVLCLQLRARLLRPTVVSPAPSAVPVSPPLAAVSAVKTRDYRFGARGG